MHADRACYQPAAGLACPWLDRDTRPVGDVTEQASEQTPAQHTGHLGSLALWVLFFVFVIYPLSICPVAKILPNPPPPVRAAYEPLGYVYLHVPVARAVLDWYAKLWGVKL